MRVPWSRPKHELLLLVLVAVAALSPIYVVSSQDISRLCLTRSLSAGRLAVTGCIGDAIDKARYRGRTYSDKAPGMSLFAVPAAEAVGLSPPSEWNMGRDVDLWLVRLATSGVAFILLAFCAGRLSEGLVPGAGGIVMVTLALGTLVGPLAATTFDHVTTATAGFGAFLFAWRRRNGVAGLLAGAAVLLEYEAAIIAVVLGGYVLLRGARPFLRYAAGTLPGLLALAAYDWAAFGSPLHPSYRYVANGYARAQSSGFFGISLPRLHSVDQVLIGDRGLLVATPVLLACVFGLVLLAREQLGEALACATVAAGFLVLSCGYFLPYGGTSPGPRFFVPALPFLAVGLGPFLARFRLVGALLALLSLVAATALTLTWTWEGTIGYRQTVWGELVRLVSGTHSRLPHDLASNILTLTGPSKQAAAVFVAVCSLAAFAIAVIGAHPRGRVRVPEFE